MIFLIVFLSVQMMEFESKHYQMSYHQKQLQTDYKNLLYLILENQTILQGYNNLNISHTSSNQHTRTQLNLQSYLLVTLKQYIHSQLQMTKKQKQDSFQILNPSEKINRGQQQGETNLLSIVKISNNKKSIKKPQQHLNFIEKVDLLKEKTQKLYKHAERKIDRMIEVIGEIDEKHLEPWLSKHGPTQSQQSKNPEANQDNHENKQETKNLNEEHSPTTEQQKSIVNKALTQLHNLLTYEKPLSHIKHQFESFYSRLSAFSKELDSEKQLPEDKKFLIPQSGLGFEETRLIEQLIKQHYLRAGYFNVAQLFDRYGKQDDNIIVEEKQNIQSSSKLWSKSQKMTKIKQKEKQKKHKSPKKSPHKKPKVQLLDIESNFRQCFILRRQLLQKKFTQAINWCVQQRLYETHSNPLQYELRLAEIKLLISLKKWQLAYSKIKGQLAKFLDNYEEEIYLLIGFLMFSCEWNPSKLFFEKQRIEQPEQQVVQQPSQQQTELFATLMSQRYSGFLIQTVDIEKLAQRFTHEYFIHYEISQFDTLEICYKVGKQYEQEYFDSIKMFSEKDRIDFLKHRVHCERTDSQKGLAHSIILPFEIPVDKQHMYHSIFVCPVTKEVLSSSDSVEFLSCGHLVSESAKKNMAEVRRSNHKQKCPVCQKDRTSEVVKVNF